MTISALFLRSLPDGTSVYLVRLDDPEHNTSILVETACFKGEIVLAEPISTED